MLGIKTFDENIFLFQEEQSQHGYGKHDGGLRKLHGDCKEVQHSLLHVGMQTED